MLGAIGAFVVLAGFPPAVLPLDVAPESATLSLAQIQGILDTTIPPFGMPCITWRIDDPATGDWWMFLSDADLSPFIGQHVTAWLNWAYLRCPDLRLVPYVSGVTPTPVSGATWGRVKSRYRDGAPR